MVKTGKERQKEVCRQNSSNMKNKTYEELYGVEKATKLREQRRLSGKKNFKKTICGEKNTNQEVWNKDKKGLQEAWNKDLTKDTSEGVRKNSEARSISMKGGTNTPESKIKCSNTMKQLVADGWKPVSGCRVIVTLDGVSFKFRSKLEVLFARLLIESGFSFEYETLRIPYKDSNNEKHTYIPDFYLREYNLVIEIKDKGNLNNKSRPYKNITEKEEATKEAGYNYIILWNTDFYANLEPSLPNHFLELVGRKVQSIGSEDK